MSNYRNTENHLLTYNILSCNSESHPDLSQAGEVALRYLPSQALSLEHSLCNGMKHKSQIWPSMDYT